MSPLLHYINHNLSLPNFCVQHSGVLLVLPSSQKLVWWTVVQDTQVGFPLDEWPWSYWINLHLLGPCVKTQHWEPSVLPPHPTHVFLECFWQKPGWCKLSSLHGPLSPLQGWRLSASSVTMTASWLANGHCKPVTTTGLHLSQCFTWYGHK